MSGPPWIALVHLGTLPMMLEETMTVNTIHLHEYCIGSKGDLHHY